MSMESKNTDADWKTALTAFETSLSTPIISGELAAWVGEAQKAWEEASAQIHFNVKHVHPRQFEEMAEEDPELLPKIEMLKAEDAAIEQERQRIGVMVARDAQHVPKLEPDEAKAQKHVQMLIDEGLAFIARVRKQEVAIQTWLVEAFNRDRGAGD
jgi:hypothetical protein